MSALPIPFSEIICYLNFYQWFDPERFISHIMALDNVWLEEAAKRDQSKRESGKSSPKPRNPR